MIVRTYKRRSRGDLLGSQGSTGDEDDELGLPIPRPLPSAGRFSQFSQEDSQDGPNSSLWNSLQHDRNCFSLPSSQSSSGVDRDDLFRIASSPTYSPSLPQQEPDAGLRPPPSIAADTLSGKLKRSVSAGQKLIRAESLLKKAKPGSLANLKRKELSSTSSAPHVCNGQAADKSFLEPRNGHVQVRETSFTEETDLASPAQISSAIGPCAPPTSTLLEAQESGEMMEHVDEVNFAMGGLRPGQPLRVCRASLVSLLTIFGTRQQRRLLRTHGMIKSVLDAVVNIPTDDTATALGAAALLYVVAHDGQDEKFLESPACIHFLLKLLSPACTVSQENRLSLLGSRLLALGSQSKPNKADAQSSTTDKGGTLLVDKVKYLLSTLMGQGDVNFKFDDQVSSSEWLVLLTLERACLSTLVLEDSAGSVCRVGGCFKERLRELGGLNVVCELAACCFANLKKIKSMADYQQKTEIINGSRGAGLLLRCLRVMENVTFLSENNQQFLLDLMLSKSGSDSPRTFLELVIETVNLLSGVISSRSREGMPHVVEAGEQANRLTKMRVPSLSNKFSSRPSVDGHDSPGQAPEAGKGKGTFDFDDDIDYSKGFDQSRKKQRIQTSTMRNHIEEIRSQKVYSNLKKKEGCDNLLEDCLLSAVKVLMNLTNDNELGCRRVAIVGGLDAMASLIVRLFPSFHTFPLFGQLKGGETFQKLVKNPVDQDLDLLVVVLGVLVNLVEKDTKNRGRLVSMNTHDFYDVLDKTTMGREHGIIGLLCSIFVSKEGAGKAVESSKDSVSSEVDFESSQKQGQQEAEDMIVEAYSALLLAFLSKESLDVRSAIAEHLPEKNLTALVPVLERFLEFHLSLNMLSPETHDTVRDVIQSCKLA